MRYKRLTTALLSAIFVVASIACSGGTRVEVKSTAASPSVTMEKYNKVTTGMTYNEVLGVMGEHGRELSRVEIPGIPAAQMLSWSNASDGSNMIVTLQNGKVVSKAQAGLK